MTIDRNTLMLATASLFALSSNFACAEDKGLATRLGEAEISVTLDAALAGFALRNAQFGAGSAGQNGIRQGGRDWIEGFAKPGVEISAPMGNGQAYGLLSAIGTITRGDGDAQATSGTSMRPSHLAPEDYAIGWRSGGSFAALGEDAIDISLGNQAFSIGDGFLILDGTAEGSRRAAYVLGPRAAFADTAILRINTAPLRADLFHLAGNVDQRRMLAGDAPATRLYGANLEWFGSGDGNKGRNAYEDRAWYLGFTALHVYDADSSGALSFANGNNGSAGGANRDGLNVFSIRSGGAVLAPLDEALEPLGEALADFGFYAEYAVQRNDSANRKVRAHAWYVEPQYTVSSLPWTPKLAYRYAYFSGDANTNDATDKSWDSLYSGGGPRGFGRWDQGEIYARYVGGNSNLASHMLHLSLQPTEAWQIGAIYYRHDFDKAPAGVSSSRLMDEIDLYAQWDTPLKGLGITLLTAAGKPGSGQKQQLTSNAAGNGEAVDRTIWLGQIVLSYSF
ncbi:alginate export family protein [Ferrovibrio sp.]|uniref:alginate export family protein n=1 Tax=Ferrovibrio sp. TaxID=1917215 RepID=UPI0025C5A181|nr:alginate export family protein [Ferrovibrio sp.]MBX3455587.1 alginate export family protein [Ferrovibrio sp.]